MPVAHLSGSALTGTTDYLLIDLSDTTNYRHAETGRVAVEAIDLVASATAAEWRLKVGLVTENDATDGSIYWFVNVPITAAGTVAYTFRFGKRKWEALWGNITSNKPGSYVSNNSQTTATWVQNDAGNVNDAAGGTTKSCAAGDIVVEAEEVSGTATFSFGLTCQYQTHPEP